MKKKLYYTFIIVFLLFIGCNNKKREVDIFDIHKAKTVGINFMGELSYGTIEEIGLLCSSRVKDSREYEQLMDTKIGGYKVEKTIEGADYAYIDYFLIRKDDKDLRTDLDSLSIKIIKEGEKYLVDEIKAKSNKSVYEDTDALRVRNEATGETNLLIRLKDLPKEMYSKGSEVIMNKSNINNKAFGKIALSFNGEKVGIVTTDENHIALFLAEMKEEKDTLSEDGGEGEEKGNFDMERNIQNALDVPIVSELIEYDLIKDAEVEELLFSSDDGELILELKEKGNSYIKVYRNNTGEIVDLKLEEQFPKNDYEVKIKTINDKGVLLEIISKENSDASEYILNLKENKIEKI